MVISDKPFIGVTSDKLKALIVQRRKDLNLSTQGFAKLVGVVEATVRNWENGRTKPNRNDIVRMRKETSVEGDDRDALNRLLRAAGFKQLGEEREDFSGWCEQHRKLEGQSPTTDLIQKVVLPLLKKKKYTFLAGWDTVDFIVPYNGVLYGVKVIALPPPDPDEPLDEPRLPSLRIEFANVVRLDSMDETEVLRICNLLNAKTDKGKFLMSTDSRGNRDINYVLNVLVPSDGGTEAFECGFLWGRALLSQYHEPLMKVRWAGADFKKALEESEQKVQARMM